MTDSIETIIRNSCRVWRENPSLGLPYILSRIINTAIIVAFIALAALFFNPFRNMEDGVFNPAGIDWSILLLDIALFAVVIIATALVSTYFHAGSIGMSYKAATEGRCSLNDLTDYGKGSSPCS